MFHELGSLKVVSPSGKEVPAQFSVLGRWGDQSVKWALVEFTAPLNAGEKTAFHNCCEEVRHNMEHLKEI